MRKIYSFLFIIALLFQACSGEDQLLIDDLGEASASAQGQVMPRMAGDGKYDLVGFSYDITGDYLHVDNAKLKVVNVEAFVADPKNVDRFYTQGSTLGKDFFYSGSNAVEFLEDIKTKSVKGGSANGSLFGLSLAANIKQTTEGEQKYTYSSKYSFARADVVKRVKRFYFDISGPADLIPYLSPAFISNLNTLSPDAFVKKYGTHVLLDITIGGRLQFNYRSSVTETDSYTQKKKITEAGAKFSVGVFGAGADKYNEKEEIKQLNTKNKYFESRLEYHGGTNSGRSYTFDSESELKSHGFDQSKWEDSVIDTNAALVEIGWDGTYPIYEFISDPTKKQAVKAAVERYIASENKDILDIVPMYALYDYAAQNSFFTANLSLYFSYPLYSGARYGAKFYIYKKKEPGTVPLHKVYDAAGKNHIYLLTGLEHYSSWTQYQGVEGYVSTTKKPGMIPIYAFYDPKTNNSFLVEDESTLPYYNSYAEPKGIHFYAYPAK